MGKLKQIWERLNKPPTLLNRVDVNVATDRFLDEVVGPLASFLNPYPLPRQVVLPLAAHPHLAVLEEPLPPDRDHLLDPVHRVLARGERVRPVRRRDRDD